MRLSIVIEHDLEKQYEILENDINRLSGFQKDLDFELIAYEDEVNDNIPLIKLARGKTTGDYILLLRGSDTIDSHFFDEFLRALGEYPEVRVFMPCRKIAFGKGKEGIVDLNEKYSTFPYYAAGCIIKSDLFKEVSFDESDEINAEIRFMLDICRRDMELYLMPKHMYKTQAKYESDSLFYRAIYEKGWYNQSFERFYLPYFECIKNEDNMVPTFIQIFFMYSLQCRIDVNWNNRNKHVIDIEEAEKLLATVGKCMKYIDDDVLFNYVKSKEINSSNALKWVFGILKYGSGYRFETFTDESGELCFGVSGKKMATIHGLSMNLVFMEYFDGRLEMDGTIHPVLYSLADEIYIKHGEDKYPLQYNGRYALTKTMGVSIYKSHCFHVSVDIDKYNKAQMGVYAVIGDHIIKVDYRFESHFSRISDRFNNSYWHFETRDGWCMVTRSADGMLVFEKTDKKAWKKQEGRLQREMLARHGKRDLLFVGIRQAYFKMKPIIKKRPIWMYIDKIYKGGDSSEYLYRYANTRSDNIDHYYLIDKGAAEYKKLVDDGFKPLIRGSIKHRLIFLLADMMVISNSTVMAFNNFGLVNSSYVRDLINFRVCCVQHGMSVQKIAVAQNRLRDNTRLYFCASKYEIENLSKPIYDYVGHKPEALKLTGVPRYDGLVNDDKKQIMISPTWRMQAAVPIKKSKNEGQQRQYNPLFKESTYYKVFNSLINDKRLIAAAKEYGYKIKYVLHPIVSSQVEDFDKNEFTEIIPAVGEMSYEKMFRESSLMVTDFSGIQFDFAYMRKPLVYLHHKDIPQHYEEGTFFYDTMAFGEITHDNDELIDVLIEYMKNGCKMKDEYIKRADDFFYFNDHNNCERIYNEMVDYQHKYILNIQ